MTKSEEMLQALENNDFIAAELAFAEALKKDPEPVLAELGEELYQLGFIEQAVTLYEQLLAKNYQTSYLLSLGELAIEEDDYDKAFQYFDDIPTSSPDYPASLLDQADLYQLIDIPEAAEQKLLQAEKILPGEPLINFALAELYFSLQQYQKAATYYLVLILDQNEEIAGQNIAERLGVSYAMSGKFEEAVDYLQKALEKEVTDDRLFYLGYTYEMLDEGEKAIELYQQLLSLNDEYQSVYGPLGNLLQKEERIEEADAVFTQGMKQNPFNVDLFLAGAQNAYRLKESTRAVDILTEALAIGDKEEEVVSALANLYLQQENFDAVLKLYQDHPLETPRAYWQQATAFNQLEDFVSAGKFFDLAAADLNHEPEFLKEYGLFLREEGRLKEARDILQHYLAHEPEDLEIQSLVAALDHFAQ